MMNKKTVINYFLIPKNLEINELLTSNPPDFKCKPDKIAYIINLLNEIPANNKKFRDSDKIPINAKLLKKKIEDYPLYLKYLTDSNVLYTNNRYVVGESSKSYSLNPTYRTELIPHYISDFTMIRKINRSNDYKRFDAKSSTNYLSKWFNKKLEIDFVAAYKYNDELYEKNQKSNIKNAYRKYSCYHYCITQLRNHDYYFHRDSTSNRLHTNLTNLKKDFRKFITYDGQQLGSCDYANSQPLLSTCLFNLDFYDKNSNDFNLFKASQKIYDEIFIDEGSFNEIFNIIQEDSLYSRNDTNYNSNANFTTKAKEGLIYEYISNAIYKVTNKKYENRNDIKKMLFLVFYSKTDEWNYQESQKKVVFKNTFPGVSNIYEFIKKGGENDNARLAVLLQTIESYLIIDIVALRIAKEKTNLPIYTAHDSIITVEGHEDYIRTVIEEETFKLIGVRPLVKYDCPWI